MSRQNSKWFGIQRRGAGEREGRDRLEWIDGWMEYDREEAGERRKLLDSSRESNLTAAGAGAQLRFYTRTH